MQSRQNSDKPTTRMQYSASPGLANELLRRKVTLVDHVARPIVEHPMLMLFVRHLVALGGIDDQQRTCDAPRFGNEQPGSTLIQMPVEVACGEAIKLFGSKWQLQAIAANE